MSRIQVTWVVKSLNGQVKGPYSTEVILRMISEGIFSGQELISKIPDGKWTAISKEPDFYDKLLEALEGIVDVDPDKAKKMEAETIIMPPPKDNPRSVEEEKTPLLQEEAPKRVIDILGSRPQIVPMQGAPINKPLGGAAKE